MEILAVDFKIFEYLFLTLSVADMINYKIEWQY